MQRFCDLVGIKFARRGGEVKNDWRSWRTEGAWLTDGQKRTLDNIGVAVIMVASLAIYVWVSL